MTLVRVVAARNTRSVVENKDLPKKLFYRTLNN
jgi:hypothetical protein